MEKVRGFFWVPVAVAPPDPFRRVFLTVTAQDEPAIRWVTTGYLGYDGWRNTGGYRLVDIVIAWAEMPDPYKGDVE